MEQNSKTKILNTVFLVSLMACVMIRLLPLTALISDNTTVRELILDGVYLFSLLLPALIGARIMGVCPHLPEKKKLSSPFVWIFIPMGIVTVSAYLNYAAVLPFEAAGIITNSQLSASVDSIPQLILMILSSAVIPPIAEEIFFRGFVLKRSLPIGSMKAIVISAAIFSLFHGNLGQIIYTFAAGVAFGYIYLLTGSILPSILLHGLNNGYSVAITAVNSFFGTDAAGLLSLSVDGVFIVGGGIALIYLIHKRKNDKGFGAITEYRTTEEPCGFPVIAVIYCAFALIQIISTNFT